MYNYQLLADISTTADFPYETISDGMAYAIVVNLTGVILSVTDRDGITRTVVPAGTSSVVDMSTSKTRKLYINNLTTVSTGQLGQIYIAYGDSKSQMPSTPFMPLPAGTLLSLGVIGPKLIASIPYSKFTASTTYYPYFPASLTRNARARTYSVYNSMNQPTTGGTEFNAYDSSITNHPAGVDGGLSWGSGIGTNTILTITSEMSSNGGVGVLAAHVDSFQGGYGMGATAPTSGSLDVYITELF